jgi:hypothetical protein
MLEATPGLRPVTLLEEMQRRYPDHEWDRLRRSLERRVRAWSAEHGADREVIFRQDHIPGQQALSDFTDMGDVLPCAAFFSETALRRARRCDLLLDSEHERITSPPRWVPVTLRLVPLGT